jgi:serine/threonine protein kinase
MEHELGSYARLLFRKVPCVPHCYGYIIFDKATSFTREIALDISGERPPFGLLLEFVDGVQMYPKYFTKAEWMLVAQAALEGLKLIHAARVLHGDPFPRNILVERREATDKEQQFRVVWIDFDDACVWPADDCMTENECRREISMTWELLFRYLVCCPQSR